jgi:hypothetical protein
MTVLRGTVDVALGAPLVVVLLLPFLAGVVGCGGSPEQEAAAAEIIDFEPQKGAIRLGSPATVSVRIKNTGAEDRTLWIGYSVQDPTEEFHHYAFFYDRNAKTFYVDGEPMKKYEGGLPDKPMKLYVNSWFPNWPDGEKPNSDRHAYVDWIEYYSGLQ